MIPSPIDCLLGHWIEAVGIKHRSLIVVAKNRDLATIDNRIETFTGVGSIPNDIAKAKHILDVLLPDVEEGVPVFIQSLRWGKYSPPVTGKYLRSPSFSVKMRSKNGAKKRR